MTTSTPDLPVQTYARIAGVLYLVIAVFGAFAIGYVPSVIVVAGDAAATASNLLANRVLFGLGMVADVIVMMTEIALTVMLYVLLKPAGPTLSLIAMVARLTMVVVMAINVLIQAMPLVLLSGAGYLGAFAPEQLQATALLFIEAHGYGIFVWDMFFGFHLAVIGYLVFRCGYFPKVLGAAMGIGSLGYFGEGLRHVTFVDDGTLGMIIVGLLALATIGELAFAFWLLIKGVNLTAWNEATA